VTAGVGVNVAQATTASSASAAYRWKIVLFIYRFDSVAGVIQLVECQLPKLDVAGSSPVARSPVSCWEEQ
jgi:hypothetical protein